MTPRRKIYFLCPVNRKPSGGVKQIYRMADLLNKNGFEAYVVHKKKHREKWFSNNTAIRVNPYLFKKIRFSEKNRNSLWHKTYLWMLKKTSFSIAKEDILVYPEIMGGPFDRAFENAFVIFNQNCYYTFEQQEPAKPSPYHSAHNLGVIVVSEDSKQYLQEVFPDLPVHRIHLGIDTQLFKSAETKKKQICFMPRKLGEDLKQLLSILHLKGQLKDWEFSSIHNKSEAEVARIFGESAIFLSLNHREGFGLPPAEAMASGCFVVGYTGEAGKEYFREEFSIAIEAGNIRAFVKAIEAAAYEFSVAPEKATEKGRLAREYILENYSLEKEEKSVLDAWKEILKKA